MHTRVASEIPQSSNNHMRETFFLNFKDLLISSVVLTYFVSNNAWFERLAGYCDIISQDILFLTGSVRATAEMKRQGYTEVKPASSEAKSATHRGISPPLSNSASAQAQSQLSSGSGGEQECMPV